MKILCVAGARPNFVKIAPLLRALASHVGAGVEAVLVDTGQHYDDAMAAAFFRDLQIPQPHHHLGIGSGSHAEQTAAIMQRFEPVLLDERPDLLVVVGDVNSTLACALVAAKCGVRIAHVEAGLRSFDRRMPEEINRLLVDALADQLFTTEESANENLAREGIPAAKVFFVGNVMVDSLRWAEPMIRASKIRERLGLDQRRLFALATLHRPANVDDRHILEGILGALAELAGEMPVLLPLHPRTRKRIAEFDLNRYVEPMSADGQRWRTPDRRVAVFEPAGYFDFLHLLHAARVVLTDSGGVQDETTCFGVPCLTLRQNTERPITLTVGTSELVGNDPQRILEGARATLRKDRRPLSLPALWDGRAAERIVRILLADG
jgi:UDP-N-acetylglucosamine 2-epimerase (non-hydrolysing)